MNADRMDQDFTEEEAQRRLEAALRGARKVGPQHKTDAEAPKGGAETLGASL